MKEVYKFHKGEKYNLDAVYKCLSFLPLDSYYQPDPANDGHTSEEHSEEVTMLKDVTIKVEVIAK